MKYKYNRKIVAQKTIELGGRDITALIITDKNNKRGGSENYYNLHILDDRYIDEEYNTLKMQEPITPQTRREVRTPEYLTARILEHFLWDSLYGMDGKLWDFGIVANATAL